METCRHCGGSNLVTVESGAGPHHAQTVCGDCGRHLRWEPEPWTDERARAFVMPFGKYRGSTLGSLAEHHGDYLAWLAENVDGNAGKAAAIILGRA